MIKSYYMSLKTRDEFEHHWGKDQSQVRSLCMLDQIEYMEKQFNSYSAKVRTMQVTIRKEEVLVSIMRAENNLSALYIYDLVGSIVRPLASNIVITLLYSKNFATLYIHSKKLGSKFLPEIVNGQICKEKAAD